MDVQTNLEVGDEEQDGPGHGYLEEEQLRLHGLSVLKSDDDTDKGENDGGDFFRLLHGRIPNQGSAKHPIHTRILIN